MNQAGDETKYRKEDVDNEVHATASCEYNTNGWHCELGLASGRSIQILTLTEQRYEDNEKSCDSTTGHFCGCMCLFDIIL